jgi:hypothetical protein
MDLTGKTLRVIFEDTDAVDIAIVENAGITVSGDDSNVASFSIPSELTSEERTGASAARYSLRDVDNGNMVLVFGIATVSTTAIGD